MSELVDIAVIGATGAVGEAIIEQLSETEFAIGQIYPVASSDSVGETVMIAKRPAIISGLADFDFSTVRLALFAVPAAVAIEYVPQATELGCTVIDCSSAFRADSSVPLVVAASLQGEDFASLGGQTVIATPGSLAAELALLLKPVNAEVEITSVSVVACMSASDAGKAGVGELASQAAGLLGGKPAEAEVFVHQTAFNLIPAVGELGDDGHTTTEVSTASELKRLLEADAMAVDVSCIQVPVFYGNGMAVTIETRYPLSAEELVQIFARIDGVSLFAGAEHSGQPTPVTDLQQFDKTCVGRIRESAGRQNGLNLWITSDNVRKSAANNALAITQLLLESYL
ncbi:MAG: aspartate-semialdehyde dehydrogenase [Gammaproteobacteria bacterium]|nr:aspartate-semialdehyde dehydrogenase [Gammaproteobacteria bacterium]MBQ0840242.1 aspartate-semialdehyde dehydrogenase [Gammaproteobacteria bacterium]